MSSTDTPGTTRRAQGLLLAGCAAALSVTAHTMGGGHLPDMVTTVALVLVVGWVSTRLAEHVHGTPDVVCVLGGAQAVTHLALADLSGHTTAGPAMAVFHGVATIGTAILFTRADIMLTLAVDVLGALFRLFVVRCPPPTGWAVAPGIVTTSTPGIHLTEVLSRRVHPLRGPPAYS